MPIDYTIDFKGLNEQLAKFEKFPQIVSRHMKPAMERSVNLLAANVRPLVPRLTGRLADSIDSDVRVFGPTAIDGVVGSSLRNEIYPAVMEFGRKSHRSPSIASISANMGLDQDSAFLVARAIAGRGTKGARFMKKGFEKSKQGILRIFEAALEHIAKDLENGR